MDRRKKLRRVVHSAGHSGLENDEMVEENIWSYFYFGAEKKKIQKYAADFNRVFKVLHNFE